MDVDVTRDIGSRRTHWVLYLRLPNYFQQKKKKRKKKKEMELAPMNCILCI